MFVVIDGLDGGGKTTQLNMLADWFRNQGRKVVVCKDPGSTELGEQIRTIVLGKHNTPIHIRAEMMLFTTARTQLVEQIIRPALQASRVVLLDRYIMSTIVYQGYAGELDPDELWTVNRIATQNLLPDVTFIFDLPVAISMSRLGESLDRMESRGEAYFEKVRRGFLAEAERWPDMVEVIDANREVQAIHDDIILNVKEYQRRLDGVVK